jgi:hypothetical protein
MKCAYLVCLFSFLTGAFLLSQSSPVSVADQVISLRPTAASPGSSSEVDAKFQARIAEGYGKLPLSFEANHGQANARVKFLARTSGYTLFLTEDEAVLSLSGRAKKSAPKGAQDLDALPVSLKRYPDTHALRATGERMTGGVLRIKLRHANPAAKIAGMDELAGTSNYFIGNDPAKWRTKVPNYAKVKYEGIYSGIDLVYYGNRSYGKEGQLEYDFIVAPGADPRRIAIDISGAKRIRRDAQGDLVIKVGAGEIRWHKPVVYQDKDGAKQGIAARYAITDSNRVTFELAKYDASRALFIDPVVYSTYLGGSDDDAATGIAVDSAGNAYVTGSTGSTNFPVTPGAFQTTCGNLNSCGNAFVTKLDPSGSALVYSTYLGGSDDDAATGIAVDSAGNAYVTGSASSTDFPITPGAFQTIYGGGASDAFVTIINSTGSALLYSTFLGGSGDDFPSGIAVNSSGNAYITGFTTSTNFPVTPGAFQTVCAVCANGDAFIAEMNPNGSALVYSTFLGGSNYSSGNGIALDSAGHAYVAGTTYSTDFPVTPGAFQTTLKGTSNAFVTKLDPTGSSLVYSTYLVGSGGDYGNGIAVDSSGDAYVTGVTGSYSFPTTHDAFQRIARGEVEAFVTKFNRSGSRLVYSTYLGGSGGDYGNAIAVDSSGNAQVTGETGSSNFPTVDPAETSASGATSFVSKFNSTGSALLYSTYLGGGGDRGLGIAVDNTGNAYVTGSTESTAFPTINPVQAANGGLADAFVVKISFDVALSPQFLSWVCNTVPYCNQPVGTTSSPQVSTLINTGNTTLIITSIGITGANSGDYAQTNNCGKSVPGGSCTFSITFTPTATGTRTAAVSIADNLFSSPQLVPLIGIGAQAVVELSPTSINFGDEPVGIVSPQQFEFIDNSGNAWLYITSLRITGPNSGEFAVSGCGGNDEGGDCEVALTFNPKATGNRSATLTITDNALGSPQSVPLTGVGTPPEAYFSPGDLSFGAQAVGTTSAPQITQLFASAPISITSITTSAEFAQTNNCTTRPVRTCQISVTFTPSAPGVQNGTLTVYDTGDESPQIISLSGTGTD